jgi:hypothetical protein
MHPCFMLLTLITIVDATSADVAATVTQTLYK